MKRQHWLTDEYKHITDIKLFAELQQKAQWHREEMYALFNALGPLHPSTVDSSLRLAGVLRTLGDFDESLELSKQAYQSRAKVFGETHSTTVDAYLNLADAYLAAGQPLEAKHIAQHVLREDFQFDEEDVLVELDAKEILADAHQLMHEEEEETKIRLEVAFEMEDIYGPNHPETLDSIAALAESLKERGLCNQAIPLFERVLSQSRQEGDIDVAVAILTDLASCYKHSGQFSKAVEYAEEAVRLSKLSYGEDDILTQEAIKKLTSLAEEESPSLFTEIPQ